MIRIITTPKHTIIPRLCQELKLHHFYVLKWKKDNTEIVLKPENKQFGVYLCQIFKRRILSEKMKHEPLPPFIPLEDPNGENYLQMTHEDFMNEFDYVCELSPDQKTALEELERFNKEFPAINVRF